jgi:hypothetical protein
VMRSLCLSCAHVKVVESSSGSRFLMCQLSRTDPRYRKYAPQPVLTCPGHEPPSGDAQPRP